MASVKSAITSVVAWTLGAVTAIAVGLIALSMIGVSLTNDPVQPLSVDSFIQPTDSPSGTQAATPKSQTPKPQTPKARPPAKLISPMVWLSTKGGLLQVRCENRQVRLFSWSPAQGYQVDRTVERGPAPMIKVTFHGRRTEVKAKVTCSESNSPQLDAHEDTDHPDGD